MRRRPGSSVVVDIVDHRGEVRGHRGVARRHDPGLPAADDRRRRVRADSRGAEVCSSATLPLSLGLPILVGSVAAPLTVAVILLRRSAARRERSTANALAAL